MPQIGIGGAETQLYALIVNSDPQVVTHEVLYYSGSSDDEGFKLYTGAGIKYTRIPRNKKRPIKFLRDFAGAIKARKPDIVHCWLWSGNIWGRWAALLAGAKNIIIAHRNCRVGYPLITRFLEMFTIRKVHYLANSQACANYIGKKIGVNPRRFCVIYNGLDAQKFEIPSQKQRLFGSLGIPDNVKIVTMVGRLRAQKNYPMFLRVAREAQLQNLPLHFIAVGTGAMKDELVELAAGLGVQDRVHFIGLRTDIPAILRSSDIFLFTTLYEGFPNALLEAMAAGLPVITTNFAGADELIKDGINGRIVSIGDEWDAVRVLQHYLDHPDQARQMAIRAQEFVRQEFSMQKMVKKTTALYKAILAGECKPGEAINLSAIERYA
jgi:glycosyltransferase involved in cell wall biosynthesis